MTGQRELNCNEFVELVTAFLDGALDLQTQQQVETHLAGCDGCDQYLEQIRQTIQTVGELPPRRLSPDARQALLGAFRRRRD